MPYVLKWAEQYKKKPWKPVFLLKFVHFHIKISGKFQFALLRDKWKEDNLMQMVKENKQVENEN